MARFYLLSQYGSVKEIYLLRQAGEAGEAGEENKSLTELYYLLSKQKLVLLSEISQPLPSTPMPSPQTWPNYHLTESF
jgi:hypothetical protein